MNESTNSAVNSFPIELPELSLQVASFLQIGFYILLALTVYYFARRLLLVMSNSGALEKRTLYYRVINFSTFVVPIFIFLYGLTNVSEDSLFVSLLFFVIFSIVFAFSLIEPTKALFASLLITVRGDLKVGDYITFDGFEGEITAIGAFNIIVHAKNGAKTVIPTQQIMQNTYELHAKKGGPSVVLNFPADKISKKNLERLAHLCPFKRKASDIRISTLEGTHKLSIEIINRESRPWVNRYFEKHFQ